MSAAPPLAPGRHARTVRSSCDGTEQPYGLFLPESASADSPVPLVVALHGHGGSWESWLDLTGIVDWAAREGFAVATPHSRGDWFYLGPGERDTEDVLDDVLGTCPVDPERVHLIGHSMGGWGAWHFGCAHADRFASLTPMSGWAPLELLPNARHLAPTLVHGAGDEVVPAIWSRMAADHLHNLGITHTHLVLPNWGHESKMIDEVLPDLTATVRERQRVAAPEHVTLSAHTPRRGHVHWLHLIESGHFPHAAQIDGTCRESKIRLRTTGVRRFAVDVAATPLAGVSGAALVVDHAELPVPPHGEGQVIGLRRVHRSWMSDILPRDSLWEDAAQPLAHLEAPINDPANTLARLVCQRTGTNALLLPQNFLPPEIPAGPVTLDTVWDIFLRPEDALHQAYFSPDELRAMLERGEALPPWWGGLRLAPEFDLDTHEGALLVAVPEVLQQESAPIFFPTQTSIREVVFNHLRERGHFA